MSAQAPHSLISGRKAPLSAAGVIGVITLLSILFGLIAATANPIAIAIASGAVLGAMLLARLDLAIWILLVGTLVLNGIIGLVFPSAGKVAWALSLLGFFLLIGAVFHTLLQRSARLALPGFVVAILLMVALGLCLVPFGKGDALEFVAGSKRAFQMIGLMVAIAVMSISASSGAQLGRWAKFLFVVALLQLPFALFQRLVLVPARSGLGDGVVPIDIVSGTFEASLEGGGSSSIMVMFLIPMLAFVLTAWKDGAMAARTAVPVTLILATPLFLGETKIALVLLPLMFVVVYLPGISRRPVLTFGALAAGVVVTGVLGWIYFSVFASGTSTPEQQIRKAIDYNFGNVGYYDRYGLNRTTATTFWFKEHGAHNPVQTLFGHGIGSSYSGSGSLVPGHLNKPYRFLAINLTGISTLLWDVGLIGTGLFLYAVFAAWRAARRLYQHAAPGLHRARMAALGVSIACIGFSLCYSNSMFASLSHEVIIAFTFGYLAWLVRADRADSGFDVHTHSLPHARVAS